MSVRDNIPIFFQLREYTSSLIESYSIPPVCEARESENTEHQDYMKHTILLILLCCSMFTGA